MRFSHKLAIGAVGSLVFTFAASAHTGAGGVVDFRAGAQHPFTGLGHVLAMIAVGLIAARASAQKSPVVRRQQWLLPVLFVGATILGGLMALMMPGPAGGPVQHLVAASVVIFGLLLVAAGQLPESSAIGLVPLFALFHGYAHMSDGVAVAGRGPVGYGVGMIVATAMILAAGMAVGLLVRARTSDGDFRPVGPLLRVMGAAVAFVGIGLLAQSF